MSESRGVGFLERDQAAGELEEPLNHHGPGAPAPGPSDVWESREDIDRFTNETLMPAMQKLAGDQVPQQEPTFDELHNEFHGS